MTYIGLKMVAKPGVAELVEACARGTLSFDDLCKQVVVMGYKTTSLHEMVRAAEETFRRADQGVTLPVPPTRAPPEDTSNE
jgi:hypothetical protein